jgi:nucleoid DNA-binding protein
MKSVVSVFIENPNTGGDMMVAPRRVVTFRCSGILRERVNGDN